MTNPCSTAGLTRRSLIQRMVATGGLTLITAGAAGIPVIGPALAAGNGFRFLQGLASADPTPDGVILWTRVQAADGATPDAVPLTLQMAETPDFSRVVVDRTVEALAAHDHTVRALVTGLQPDRVYHYRFLAQDGSRPEFTGRTRTAPLPEADRPVRLAFVSCQSFEDGYYGAYRAIINQDRTKGIDFVLHLGDQIYETVGYGQVRNAGPLPSGGRPIREAADGKGPVQADGLEDFRHLYRTFLSDPDYRQARALFPFVSIWDDHEFSNDNWQTVTTYMPAGRSAAALKAAANQAWFEYIPARLDADFQPAELGDGQAATAPTREDGLADDPDNLAALGTLGIYRALRWGRNVELVLTDTRSYRSDHAVPDELAMMVANTATYFLPKPLVQLMDAGRTANGGNPPATIPVGDRQVPNPRKDSPPGTLLGPQQKNWVKERLKGSDATWKLWANSVPLMPMRIDMHAIDEKATDVVLTADAWDGFMAERNELLGFLKREGVTNVVSLSGDHHQSFAGMLYDDYDAPQPISVGVEFSVAGISSNPVFQSAARLMKPDDPVRPLVVVDGAALGRPAGTMVENMNLTFLWGTRAAMTAAKTGDVAAAEAARNPRQNPHLRYCDTNCNGFGLLTADRSGVEVELVATASARQDHGRDGAPVLRTARFLVPLQEPGKQAVMDEPVVSGEKPFPLV